MRRKTPLTDEQPPRRGVSPARRDIRWDKLEQNRHLAFLPLAVSLAIFLGTMIIGDRRARTELKRRFHIN